MSGRRGQVLAAVQARMSSTRLPGKVLADIDGTSALDLLLERLSRAQEVDRIVVVTSTSADDGPIVAAAARQGVSVIRGPLDDVLERYRMAMVNSEYAAVVRITGDCPLIDPEVVDLVVEHFHAGECEYVSNSLDPRTYPDGLDVELLSRAALLRAAQDASTSFEREHVTPYIREHPELFSQAALNLDQDWSDVRITLDTPEDLEIIRKIVAVAGRDAATNELVAAFNSVRAER